MPARRTTPSPPRSSRVAEIMVRARRALGDRRAAVNVDWVERLTGAPRPSIEETLAELEEFLDMEEEIRRRHAAGGRSHYAQIRAPFELYALTRLGRPDHVVETGVSSGISSAHFLLALKKNRHGTLHSIDLPTFQRGKKLGSTESPVALPPGSTTGWAVPEHLLRNWDLRLGSSEELLPRILSEIPSVGLFLHDSLHTAAHLTFELSTVRPKLRSGALVLADNTAWTGTAFPRFARSLGVPVHPRGRSDLVGLRTP